VLPKPANLPGGILPAADVLRMLPTHFRPAPACRANPQKAFFFVVRLPSGWQLCTCRHDEYGPVGLPDFWVEALDPFLAIWLAHLQQHAPQ
jgi:hypothetical protein